MSKHCPSCGSQSIDVFYECAQIPVHSCMMLDDAASALAFPKRDLALGFCAACGFVSNVLFDSSVQHYSAGYEEQQAFSPRFRRFQTDLIAGLIDRYGVRDKDVVEIGCGKGDFLIELCEAGGNRGVGIDPTSDPARMGGRGEGRVRFIAELYGPQHAEAPCDLLCCRHTLEHIHPVGDFLKHVRRVIGEQETLVFFEVPDVQRVLDEGAFWDIYYEHCSYFSCGSLARLFRASGFEVVELGLDFDDQYVMLIARPARQATRATFPIEGDLERLTRSVERFRTGVRDRIQGFRSQVADRKSAGQRLAIWGSGSKCVSFLSTVGISEQIDAVIDINPFRHGKFLAGSGKMVSSPESLLRQPVDAILVMNPIYCGEIGAQLTEMGVSAELIAC